MLNQLNKVFLVLAMMSVNTASAELVGPSGVCSLPGPVPISLPQPPLAGTAFPIWVCADARAYPDGFLFSPVFDSVVISGNAIQVEVSAAEVSVLPAFPRYWQVFSTVPQPGQYTIEYYTVLRPVPGAGTNGEARTLRASLPISVGVASPAAIPVLSFVGVLCVLGGIGVITRPHLQKTYSDPLRNG